MNRSLLAGLLFVFIFIGQATRAASFAADITLPYEQIARFHRTQFAAATAKMAGINDCSLVGTKLDPRPPEKQYRCGELPFGQIDGDWFKPVLNINIPGMSGKSDGIDFKIEPAALTVSLSRLQKAGTISTRRLDDLTVGESQITSSFGSDTFLQFNPQGDRLDTRLCLGLPGLTVTAAPLTIKGRMHKKLWWIIPDINADIRVNVVLGRGSFDTGQVCSSLTTTVDAQSLPSIELTSLGTPQLLGLAHEGLKVSASADIHGFWGFVASLVKIFGVNVEKLVANAIKQKIFLVAGQQIDVALADVRSGKWFHDYVNVTMLQKQVKLFSDSLRASINSLTHGTSLEDRLVQVSCLLMTDNLPVTEAQKKIFFKLCAHSVRLDVEYFSNNSEFRKAGCYNYAFNPREIWDVSGTTPKVKWWGEGCGLVSRVTATAPLQISPLSQCLLDAHQNFLNPSASCKAQIDALLTLLKGGQLDALAAQITSTLGNLPSEREFYSMKAVLRHRANVSVPDYQRLLQLW